MTAESTPAATSVQPAPVVPWYALSPDDAVRHLEVDPAIGLTSAEADARRAKYGKNTFDQAKQTSRWETFSRQYADPMQIVLLIAGIICLFLPGQFFTGVFLILLTLFNAWMAMSQEGKAEASASALQKMMVVKSKARRGGDLIEVAMDQLVPGDIVNIEAGDLVPADARILTAATLENRRIRADRRERSHAQAGGGRRGRRRSRRSRGYGIHELPGHARVSHRPGGDHRDGDRGRPHQRNASGDHDRKDSAHQAAGCAHEPDPRHRWGRACRVHRARLVPRSPAPGAIPERRRVRGGGYPDGAPGCRHGHLVQGLPDARRGWRDHEAPALGGDAGIHVRAQLRQDWHPDVEPDDRGPDGDHQRPLLDHGRWVLHHRPDQPRWRPARRPTRAIPAADGAVRRRGGPGRRPRR